jgi:hypothetical protein
LSNFIFNFLAFIKRFKAALALNFRMMNKQVFASVLWSDKTEAFVWIEPLYGTCTHADFFLVKLILRRLPCIDFFQNSLTTSKFVAER